MTKEIADATITMIEDSEEYRMLGQGNTAEIYQHSQNRILKLFREEMPFPAIQNEYRIANIVQNKLDSVPKVYDLVKYKNRYGIVYEQIQGCDMIQILKKSMFKMKYYAKLLASTHAAIHSKDIDVHYSVKDKLKQDICSCNDLSQIEKEAILQYLKTLPEKNRICHFDFHPGNVMICDGKRIVIDWMTACTGDSNADVARTLLLLQMGESAHASSFENAMGHLLMGSIRKAYIKEYRKQTGVSIADVNAWMLPVAAARLAEWLTDNERAKLVLLVRKELANLNQQ